MSKNSWIIIKTTAMVTEFKLYEKEIEKAKEFEEKHKKCYKHTTIGGGIGYSFFPNGIGRCVSIKCGFCGEEEDITDYDLW